MLLHDAIIKVLEHAGRPMTTTEIANVLNEKKWYEKKKGNPIISPYQIHGRTKNYHQLFEKEGSLVSLKSKK